MKNYIIELWYNIINKYIKNHNSCQILDKLDPNDHHVFLNFMMNNNPKCVKLVNHLQNLYDQQL